jgi:hypothetical protein
MFRGSLLATFLSFPCGALQACQDDHSAQAIRLDREQLDNGNWIYHDFAQGVAAHGCVQVNYLSQLQGLRRAGCSSRPRYSLDG